MHSFKQSSSSIILPPPLFKGQVDLETILWKRRSVRSFQALPISLNQLGQLLWSAQGVTTQDGRRTTPSAGATYPLEVLAVVGYVEDLSPGIYRYQPYSHSLIVEKQGDWRNKLSKSALEQAWVGEAPLTIVVTGVIRRIMSRYGMRAYRYMWMEAGHAIEHMHLEAVAMGLGGVIVGAFDDENVAHLLNLGEGEEPLSLFCVGKT